MSQPIFTPEISNCSCGAKAHLIDWDFNDVWKVWCDNNHRLRGQGNITRNRAVHKWNNFLKKGIKLE